MEKQIRLLKPRKRKEDKERDWETPPPLLRSRDTQTRPHPSLVGWGRAEIPTDLPGPGQISTSPSQAPCLSSLRSPLPSPSLFVGPKFTTCQPACWCQPRPVLLPPHPSGGSGDGGIGLSHSLEFTKCTGPLHMLFPPFLRHTFGSPGLSSQVPSSRKSSLKPPSLGLILPLGSSSSWVPSSQPCPLWASLSENTLPHWTRSPVRAGLGCCGHCCVPSTTQPRARHTSTQGMCIE